jgi:membrane-associated phospholipid phosphatase
MQLQQLQTYEELIMSMSTRLRTLLPFCFLTFPLPAFTWLLTGFDKPFWFSSDQLYVFFSFAFVVTSLVFLFNIFFSLVCLKRYVNPVTKHVQIKKMLNEHNPLADGLLSILLIVGFNFSISGIPMIAEIYKMSASIWYDEILWQLEKPLIHLIQINVGPLMLISTWDNVYHLLWLYILAALAALLVAKQDHDATEMMTAAVFIFYITHIFALILPTKGPAIYQPNEYSINGTLSLIGQNLLLAYQNSETLQNGLYYGLVAMPSVHVALTFLVSYFLMKLNRSLGVISLLWSLICWFSTIILGWHYIFDGVAGLIIATISIAGVKWLSAILGISAKQR